MSAEVDASFDSCPSSALLVYSFMFLVYIFGWLVLYGMLQQIAPQRSNAGMFPPSDDSEEEEEEEQVQAEGRNEVIVGYWHRFHIEFSHLIDFDFPLFFSPVRSLGAYDDCPRTNKRFVFFFQ